MLAATTIFAQQLATQAADSETAKLITEMIPRYHLSRQRVDDGIAAKLLPTFIKDLDPQKQYFLQSDISDFERSRDTLDDALRDGNLDFAFRVFDVYSERLHRQLEVAHQLIDAEHDFTVDEEITISGDDLAWATSEAELDERWRKRIKYQLLDRKLDGTEVEEAREQLHKRYRNVKLNMDQMNEQDKLEIYLTALTRCFDPHSSYMSPQTWQDFEIQLRLSLDGIGAALRADDGYTVVAQIVPGGAADKDGRLKVGDKIVGVGQEEGEIEDIFEMKLSDVVRKIRGKRGTVVRLRVKPADGGESVVYDLTRQKIELKESEVKGEVLETTDRLGREGRVGIIQIPSFYRDFAGAQSGVRNFKSAAADVAAVLESFSEQGGVDAIVIDLRNNGGGALSEAIEISGLFIDQGPVVQVKEPSGRVQSLEDEDPGVLYSGPLVVLCNRSSASASEIFAGVIKDYRRGIVVGDTTTHGKGTVQNLMDVAPNQMFRILQRTQRGKLKLTIQQFYRVNGHSTQNNGVPSDIVLPSLIDHWDLGEAFLDNALPFDRIRPAVFSPGRFVSEELIAGLQQRSEQRIRNDDDFQKIEKAIRRYLDRKSRKTVSLKEETMKAEREADEELVGDSKELEETAEPETGADATKEEIFPESYYNDEVLNITLDYIRALQGAVAAKR
ncbi:Tail-specific protease precursor [Maioricimonas rarisocia]|uniref:Tail-specific protease n=2 Tax=Maioricimonas rarisocia TaxID=2528026 RepID=A0A517Z5T6_9PLAN|nr:Tail-specific protease precursor [Maioricimonas rarisocia]